MGPQHVDTFQVQNYLNRTFSKQRSDTNIDIENRKRNGTEIARFAKYVLGVQINLLKFNKWRSGGKVVYQMSDSDFGLLKQLQSPTAVEILSLGKDVSAKQESELAKLFESKYKPALEMIIQTGCRPSEALYAANFGQLWTKKSKTMIFTVPQDLSKTGFEQQWTFDMGYSVKLADRLYRGASSAAPCDEFSDSSSMRLRYNGLQDYFKRVQKVLGLGGYRD